MGLFAAKPENRYVRDRVRLCDGLKPIFGQMVAAGGNGRHVFILGDKQLDCIDLMRSVRTRIECVGGFCNFGSLVGFYALDERTVVLVDFNDAQRTMRQRLVAVDERAGRAHAWLDRGYRLTTRALFFIGKTAVSEDRAVTIAPSLTGRLSPIALVYPKHPLNLALPVINISGLLVEAGNRIREMAEDAAEGERMNLSCWDAPFFLSATKIGFFTDRSGQITVDPSLIVACNIESGSISVERSKPDAKTGFPHTKEGSHPYDCRSFTASRDQLGLLVAHRCPSNTWRSAIGKVTEQLSKWSFYAFIVLAQNQWAFLSHKFLSLSIFLGLLRFRILRPPGARIGVMDTRTLQWTEQVGASDPAQWPSMKASVFADGQTLIYDRVAEKRVGTREIGANSYENEPTEELRILSNPGRVSSLKTLAEMRLRKNVMTRSDLEQISARV